MNQWIFSCFFMNHQNCLVFSCLNFIWGGGGAGIKCNIWKIITKNSRVRFPFCDRFPFVGAPARLHCGFGLKKKYPEIDFRFLVSITENSWCVTNDCVRLIPLSMKFITELSILSTGNMISLNALQVRWSCVSFETDYGFRKYIAHCDNHFNQPIAFH